MEWSYWADARLALAGALGGCVSWLTRKGSFSDGMVQIVVGAICALYLSPLAIPALTPALGAIIGTPAELARLSAFVIGVGGVSVSGFVLDVWHWRRRRLTTTDGDKPNG